MNIELHIERLVLEGIDIPSGGAEQLRGGVSAELTHLLRDGGLAGSLLRGGAAGRLTAPSATLSAGRPGQLGGQLASAIYAGIGR